PLPPLAGEGRDGGRSAGARWMTRASALPPPPPPPPPGGGRRNAPPKPTPPASSGPARPAGPGARAAGPPRRRSRGRRGARPNPPPHAGKGAGTRSRKPPLQHPVALLARRGEGPGALALRGFDDVVVAARVLAVPPAALQPFGPGNDARARVAQRDRTRQQPARTRRTRRRLVDVDRAFGHPPPRALGARVTRGRDRKSAG